MLSPAFGEIICELQSTPDLRGLLATAGDPANTATAIAKSAAATGRYMAVGE